MHKCDIIFYIQIKKVGLRTSVCVKQKENKSKNEREEEVWGGSREVEENTNGIVCKT